MVDADGTMTRQAGERMPASYINFYIGNGAVYVPSFNDPQDSIAEKAIAALFPDRKVVMLPGREVLLGGGNFHCITQQQPRAM